MNIKPSILIYLLLSILVLSSCTPAAAPSPIPPTADTNAIATVIAQTVEAQNLQKIVQQQPTNTNTPIAAPSETPEPTATITATALPVMTPTPVVLLNIPCNKAAFVNDITVPDGSVIASGASFIKTWRLMNMGTCVWTPAYRVLYDHGDLLGGTSMVTLPGFVNPGQVIDISISMVAPTSDGTYAGFWMLQDASGNNFGVGSSGNDPFDVNVVVGTTLPAFTVTHVVMGVDNVSVTTTCGPGYTFNFSGNIFTNGPGSVQYHWVFSDGSNGPVQTLNFTGVNKQAAAGNWALGQGGPVAEGNPYNGWAQIYIDSPNQAGFDKVNFTLTCK
jgi:hypothetical protein